MGVVADMALTARDLVAQGWCQNAGSRNVDGNQEYCALGAASEAFFRFKGAGPQAWDNLDRLFAEQIGLSSYAIPEWNDAPERTQAEVVDAWDEVARKAKELDL